MATPHQVPAEIAIQVGDVRQLINSLDPSPFRTRDLDRDAEEHVLGWARELPGTAPIAVSVHLPAVAVEPSTQDELREIFSRHFGKAAEACNSDLRELLRIGRIQLAIGFVVLLLCLGAGQFLIATFGNGPAIQFIEQGLLILGWVANWKPLETFLYDWWPIIRRRRLLRRLAAAEIRLVLS